MINITSTKQQHVLNRQLRQAAATMILLHNIHSLLKTPHTAEVCQHDNFSDPCPFSIQVIYSFGLSRSLILKVLTF